MYSRVYLEITNKCNMRCSFCHGHSRPYRQMTREEFLHILNELNGITNYIYYHLMGEPLLHPEILEFLTLAKERGFKSMITTNGTLIGKKGEDIVKAGVHKVNISLHSYEDQGEEYFFKYLSDVATFADFASKNDVIVVLRLWNNGIDEENNRKIIAFLKEKLKGEWEENSKGIRIRYKLHLEWGDRFEWPDKEAPDYGNEVFCYGMRDHFGILSDGTVVPCCLDSDGVINLGNAYERSLKEIITSPRAKAIREGFGKREAVEDLCKRCAYARRFK